MAHSEQTTGPDTNETAPAQPAGDTGPTPRGAAAGTPAVRQAEQAEIAAENRQSAVEGSDDYLRRNQGGKDAAEAAVGKPAPGADGGDPRQLHP